MEEFWNEAEPVFTLGFIAFAITMIVSYISSESK